MNTDAIVNAANTKLQNYATRRGGGVCGAIFRAAGHNEMQEACSRIGGCETGNAVITEGFALPAKYVIHAVGPRYEQGNKAQVELLRSSYICSLKLAEKYNLRSVSFPLISSGIFGYPPLEAMKIAVDVLKEYLKCNQMEIYLCIRDEALLEAAEIYAHKQL